MPKQFLYDVNLNEEYYLITCIDTNETIDSRDWNDPKDAHNLGYLDTLHWKNTRANYILTHGNTCERCLNNGYAVMHITKSAFKNLGNETDEDLIYLCEECSKAHYNNFFRN